MSSSACLGGPRFVKGKNNADKGERLKHDTSSQEDTGATISIGSRKTFVILVLCHLQVVQIWQKSRRMGCVILRARGQTRSRRENHAVTA